MKNTQSFSVLAILRKAKLNKSGEAPIYIRVTVNGEIVELSLKHNLAPSLWDSAKGRAKGRTEVAKSINSDIEAYSVKARTVYNNLVLESKTVTSNIVKRHVLGDKTNSPTLLSVFDKMVSDIRALIGKDYTESTYKNYLASQRQLHKYVSTQYKVKDISLNDLDYRFIADYEMYLKTLGGCTQNGCIKHMQKLRKAVTIALQHDYFSKDPFLRYSIKKKKTEVQPLTKHELQALEARNFEVQRLNIIKDLFLFSCYTGLAFADVSSLRSENIGLGIDGSEWIFINRKKTGNVCRIPLLAPAKAILIKYQHHPKVVESGNLLPLPSNQKYNAYLKEVADLCSISKNLTTHIGRHTFATTVALQNGVSMEVVKEILGHNNITTTQIYAKVNDDLIATAVQPLKEKLFSAESYRFTRNINLTTTR
ncbi:site-specific integrase [Pontibacter russatus]|uniref:site-specific integrase n=1 Tax=Pontibacter russatus TaxID=2694929 RepID=UPI00137979B5|nr:site-specific integrase [Pontibacter russatus]